MKFAKSVVAGFIDEVSYKSRAGLPRAGTFRATPARNRLDPATAL